MLAPEHWTVLASGDALRDLLDIEQVTGTSVCTEVFAEIADLRPN